LFDSTATIARSTIADNGSSYVGGIRVGGGDSRLTIADSTIVGNRSILQFGGGISAIAGAELVVRNSTITGNVALYSLRACLSAGLRCTPYLAADGSSRSAWLRARKRCGPRHTGRGTSRG
jgi:hypothetical protein